MSYFVDLEFEVIEGKIKFKYLNNFMCIVHVSISFVVVIGFNVLSMIRNSNLLAYIRCNLLFMMVFIYHYIFFNNSID